MAPLRRQPLHNSECPGTARALLRAEHEGTMLRIIDKTGGEGVEVRHKEYPDAALDERPRDLPSDIGALPFVCGAEGLVEEYE